MTNKVGDKLKKMDANMKRFEKAYNVIMMIHNSATGKNGVSAVQNTLSKTRRETRIGIQTIAMSKI
jgi:hypothetical protein